MSLGQRGFGFRVTVAQAWVKGFIMILVGPQILSSDFKLTRNHESTGSIFTLRTCQLILVIKIVDKFDYKYYITVIL